MVYKIRIVVSEMNLGGKPSGHIAYYAFNIGKYQDVISFNAFFNGRHRCNHTKTKLFMQMDKVELEFKRKFGLINEDLPVMELENIWHFYHVIGFDYRKRKYISKE